MVPRPSPQPRATGSGRKSDDERWAAVHSLRMAKAQGLGYPQVTKAKQYYQQMAPTSIITKWRTFAVRWMMGVRKGTGVADAKRSGRPPKVTPMEALIIATKLTQGTVGRGPTKRPYCSMEEVSWP